MLLSVLGGSVASCDVDSCDVDTDGIPDWLSTPKSVPGCGAGC